MLGNVGKVFYKCWQSTLFYPGLIWQTAKWYITMSSTVARRDEASESTKDWIRFNHPLISCELEQSQSSNSKIQLSAKSKGQLGHFLLPATKSQIMAHHFWICAFLVDYNFHKDSKWCTCIYTKGILEGLHQVELLRLLTHSSTPELYRGGEFFLPPPMVNLVAVFTHIDKEIDLDK